MNQNVFNCATKQLNVYKTAKCIQNECISSKVLDSRYVNTNFFCIIPHSFVLAQKILYKRYFFSTPEFFHPCTTIIITTIIITIINTIIIIISILSDGEGGDQVRADKRRARSPRSTWHDCEGTTR